MHGTPPGGPSGGFYQPSTFRFAGDQTGAVKALPAPTGVATEAIGATFLGIFYALRRRAGWVRTRRTPASVQTAATKPVVAPSAIHTSSRSQVSSGRLYIM